MTLENNLGQSRHYDRLAQRLKEIAGSMTPEEIDVKFGKGASTYYSSIDNLMTYLAKERRKVDERRENIPKEYYEQTQHLDFPSLKNWYAHNQGLKQRQTQHKTTVYTQRLLELIAKKFEVEIKPIPKRSNEGRIRNAQDLQKICDTDPKARYLIYLCGGDDVDVADIIAVVYDGKITRDDAIKLLQEPSLRNYLGDFRKTIGIPDIKEYADELLPLDKNNVIASIIFKRLIEYRRQKLGAKPTKDQRNLFLQEMQKTLEDLV